MIVQFETDPGGINSGTDFVNINVFAGKDGSRIWSTEIVEVRPDFSIENKSVQTVTFPFDRNEALLQQNLFVSLKIDGSGSRMIPVLVNKGKTS